MPARHLGRQRDHEAGGRPCPNKRSSAMAEPSTAPTNAIFTRPPRRRPSASRGAIRRGSADEPAPTRGASRLRFRRAPGSQRSDSRIRMSSAADRLSMYQMSSASFSRVGKARIAVDLSPAGEARPHLATHDSQRTEGCHRRWLQWTWPDEVHVAGEDRSQLRDLVEPHRADEPGHGRLALGVRQELPVCIAEVVHRAKLDKGERGAAEPAANLAKQQRPPERKPDEQRPSALPATRMPTMPAEPRCVARFWLAMPVREAASVCSFQPPQPPSTFPQFCAFSRPQAPNPASSSTIRV